MNKNNKVQSTKHKVQPMLSFIRLFMLLGCQMFFLAYFPLSLQADQRSIFGQRTTPAQDIDQARLLEEMGQLERAAAQYEMVLRKSPFNAPALNALPRLYVNLQQYDKAIGLLGNQIERSPRSIVFRRSLADVFLRAGRLDIAREQCAALIEIYPKDESVIRLIAALYVTYAHYQEAVQTYVEGRRAIGNPGVFALPLANIYTTLVDVPNATAEYARWLTIQPRQFPVVDDRIDQLTGLMDPKLMEKALRGTTSEHADNKDVHKLFGNFYLRHNQPVEALEQYRKADQLDGSRGVYLLEFATWAMRETHHEEAISAYKDLMDTASAQSIKSQASVGLAEAYRFLGRRDEAMTAYQQTLSQYPRTAQSEEAMFHIAELHLTYLHDPSKALIAFRTLLAAAPGSSFRAEAMFRMADCHLSRGSIRDAITQYNRILDPSSKLEIPHVFARAKFHLAEMDLFRGELDSALEKFNEVADGFTGNAYANDALQWSIFLSESRRGGGDSVKAFINAHLLKRQYKPDNSLDAYKQFLSDHANSPIGDLAILEIGVLLDEMQKPHEAIAAFRDLIDRYPESRLGINAQHHIAEIYEHRLMDIPQAITEYETILINYPDHFKNDAIRRRVRDLTLNHPPQP